MDGISVRRPFPLGSRVLRARGSGYRPEKKDNMKGGGGRDANSLFLSLASHPPQSLSISVTLPTLHRPNTPPPLLPQASMQPPPYPRPQPFTPKKTLKLHHRGLTGNPDTTHCRGGRGGLGGFATPSGSFFSFFFWGGRRRLGHFNSLSLLTNLPDTHTHTHTHTLLFVKAGQELFSSNEPGRINERWRRRGGVKKGTLTMVYMCVCVCVCVSEGGGGRGGGVSAL